MDFAQFRFEMGTFYICAGQNSTNNSQYPITSESILEDGILNTFIVVHSYEVPSNGSTV